MAVVEAMEGGAMIQGGLRLFLALEAREEEQQQAVVGGWLPLLRLWAVVGGWLLLGLPLMLVAQSMTVVEEWLRLLRLQAVVAE